MKQKGLKPIRRRDFLISTAGLAGAALPGVGWAAAKPCPPPSLSVTGGSTVSSRCSAVTGILPAFELTSAGASGSHPWTIGHAFRKGDVPLDSEIASDSSDFQADVRNRWSDGSAKFAVLSGISGFSQGLPKSISLRVIDSTPARMNIAEPTTADVTISFSGDVNGTYSLQSALGVYKEVWNGRAGGGRVRKLLGPVMSEFHYYLPTTDAHIAIWFHVRRYSTGAMEVETVVENGWVRVASPGQRNYTVALNVGGRQVYSGTVSHYHHTRWSRADWIGADPQILPRHDLAYLRSTGLVPNYIVTATPTATYAVKEQSPTPFSIGDLTNSMGDTGDHPTIGPLQKHESAYFATGYGPAYLATVGNARLYGRYCTHYRDEATGLPVDKTSAANGDLSINNSNSGVGNNAGNGSPTPAPTGAPAWGFKYSHHPSAGYGAYLATGRWVFMEEQQFCAMTFLMSRGTYTQGTQCLIDDEQVRETAWAFRTLGQAACITPTTHPLATAFTTIVANNVSSRIARFVSSNPSPLGVWALGSGGAYDTPDADWDYAPWMFGFGAVVLSWVTDMEVNGQTSVLRNHALKHPVAFCGLRAGWHYVHCSSYQAPYGSTEASPSNWYSAGTAYDKWLLKRGFSKPASDNSGQTLINADGAAVTESWVLYGYTGQMRGALACAVDAGVPDALQAWSRLNSAPNINVAAVAKANDPRWAAIEPRSL